MEGLGAHYAVIANNDELWQGAVRDAELSRRSRRGVGYARRVVNMLRRLISRIEGRSPIPQSVQTGVKLALRRTRV
jgi:hypothetical protein